MTEAFRAGMRASTRAREAARSLAGGAIEAGGKRSFVVIVSSRAVFIVPIFRQLIPATLFTAAFFSFFLILFVFDLVTDGFAHVVPAFEASSANDAAAPRRH